MYVMNSLRSTLTHAMWASFSTEIRKRKKVGKLQLYKEKNVTFDLEWRKRNSVIDLKWRNDNVAAGSARTGGLLVTK